MYVVYYATMDNYLDWVIRIVRQPLREMYGVESCWMIPGTVED